MRNALAVLLAFVFGLAVGLTIIAWAAGSTILKPQAVLAAVPAATYSEIAKALPQALGQLTPLTSDEKVILAGKIDPGLVRQITDATITSELQYWHGQGRTPQLDLRELSDRLRTEGAPVPQDLYDRLDRPVTLQSTVVDQTVVPLVGWLDRLRWLGPLLSVAAAVLIWVLGAHLRYRTLAKGLAVALVVVGVSMLFVQLLPSIASSGLTTSALTALAAPIRAAISAVCRPYSELAVKALIGLAAGIVVLMAAHVILGRKPKHRH